MNERAMTKRAIDDGAMINQAMTRRAMTRRAMTERVHRHRFRGGAETPGLLAWGHPVHAAPCPAASAQGSEHVAR